jgi:hypothetical protein
VVKDVLKRIEAVTNPLDLLSSSIDFFGQPLPPFPHLVKAAAECDQRNLKNTLQDLLGAACQVIKKQYAEFLNEDAPPLQEILSDTYRMQTATARTSNIDAEELVGMFSAALMRAPSATVDLHSSKILATKNLTITYLDSMDTSQRDDLVMKAVSIAKKQRNNRKILSMELKAQIIQRQQKKAEERCQSKRRGLEKLLKKHGLQVFLQNPSVPRVEDDSQLIAILDCDIIDQHVVHFFNLEDVRTEYSGIVLNYLYSKKKYKMQYHREGVDGIEIEYHSPESLVVDFVFGDLIF